MTQRTIAHIYIYEVVRSRNSKDEWNEIRSFLSFLLKNYIHLFIAYVCTQKYKDFGLCRFAVYYTMIIVDS